jgi:hypothetical protein
MKNTKIKQIKSTKDKNYKITLKCFPFANFKISKRVTNSVKEITFYTIRASPINERSKRKRQRVNTRHGAIFGGDQRRPTTSSPFGEAFIINELVILVGRRRVPL